MNCLDDLKRQLAVICVDYYKDRGNTEYRTTAQILNDIGEVYQKYYNAGISLRNMQLLDRVYCDVVKDWDRLTKVKDPQDWDRLTSTKDPVKEIEEATPAYLTIGNEEFIFLYGGQFK